MFRKKLRVALLLLCEAIVEWERRKQIDVLRSLIRECSLGRREEIPAPFCMKPLSGHTSMPTRIGFVDFVLVEAEKVLVEAELVSSIIVGCWSYA